DLQHRHVVVPHHLDGAPRPDHGCGAGAAPDVPRATGTGSAMTVLDRFLRYVQYDTQSHEQSTTYPSTDTQLVLLRDLVAELKAIGLADAAIDEHGYVTATIPATT